MIYTVYARPDDPEELVAVPEGGSKWAFVFGTLWLLWNRLWWAALVFLLVGAILNAGGRLALNGAEAWYAGLAGLALTLLPRLWLALEGHELRRRRLERRGWLLTDTVEATRRADAETIALARAEERRGRARLVRERERAHAAALRAERLAPRSHRPRPPLPQPAQEPVAAAREPEAASPDAPSLRLVETIVARPQRFRPDPESPGASNPDPAA